MTGRHAGWPMGSAIKDSRDTDYVGRHREPDDPLRCWSCGHTTDMFCECSCCNDDDPDGEWNPNA